MPITKAKLGGKGENGVEYYQAYSSCYRALFMFCNIFVDSVVRAINLTGIHVCKVK